MNTSQLLKFFLLPLTTLTISFLSSAKEANPTSPQPPWTNLGGSSLISTVAAWILSFLAASISSAGGVGGGSLFLPILNLVAGLSLKRATTFTAFMVTGGALSNVLYTLVFKGRDPKGRALINYDIAVLSQPCLLLGVSIGVVCNVMFPEWLITVLFALFLAFCTYKTCMSGVRIWGAESTDQDRGICGPLLDVGVGEEEDEEGGGELGLPWKDVVVLVMAWLCFFVLHVLIGDKHGKGMIRIQPCGVAYWLITASQIPFAMAFTAYIVYAKRRQQVHNDQQDGKANPVKNKMAALPVFVFPLAALLTGILSGLLGIGGGLLINPALLQIGVPPQTAASTTTFMVLFCGSMSMVQYMLLGMNGINQALIYAAVCFVASVVGLVVMERAIRKSGRVSLIVFLVTAIMALSTVIVTCFGAADAWRQYTSGENMGFKLPC